MAIEKIGAFVERGTIEVLAMGSAPQTNIFALMRKYRQVPMAYADACSGWPTPSGIAEYSR
jgi:hypothetical protein